MQERAGLGDRKRNKVKIGRFASRLPGLFVLPMLTVLEMRLFALIR